MKIWVPEMHPGFMELLCRTGHDFYVKTRADTWVGAVWKNNIRPRPPNLHHLSELKGRLDLAITCEVDRPRGVPFIFLALSDAFDPNGRGVVKLMHRASASVFLSNEIAQRSPVPAPRVIPLGVDSEQCQGYTGVLPKALAIGHTLKTRAEKGYANLREINTRVPMTVLGHGNTELSGHTFIEDYALFLETVRQHRVFINPSHLVCHSVLEMLSIGMPVVQFRPVNYTRFLQHNHNCCIVDTREEAVEVLNELLRDSAVEERARLGAQGRADVMCAFGVEAFIDNWNNIIKEVGTKRSRHPLRRGL